MQIGLRSFKSASLRIAEPQAFDDQPDYVAYRAGIREVVDLKAGNPREGHATRLLHNVCTEADVEAKVLLLTVQQYDDGPDNSQLIKFYRKFGFVPVQDEPAVLMARQPSS